MYISIRGQPFYVQQLVNNYYYLGTTTTKLTVVFQGHQCVSTWVHMHPRTRINIGELHSGPCGPRAALVLYRYYTHR